MEEKDPANNGKDVEIREFEEKIQDIEKECEKSSSRIERGLVHIYYGDGRGKTSIALGTALRASGYNLRTKVIQFMKGIPGLGESRAKLPNFEVKQFGIPEYLIDNEEVRKKQAVMAREGLKDALNSMNSGRYDIVVLDEALYAVEFNVISKKDVIEIIRAKPERVELIITGGRNVPPEIIELADYVSHVVMERHPYNRGIKARPGIDF
jgi:cob(I)alamin adenosyltransferase